MVTESLLLPSIYEFIEEKKIDEIFNNFITEAKKRKPIVEDEVSVVDPFRVMSAIETRNYVGVYYEEPSDEDETIVKKGFRLCECYVYGTGYRFRGKTYHKDREYLRVFVIRDTNSDATTASKFKDKRKSVSKSKRIPYWRLMRLDRVQDFTILPRKFSNYRELYNPDDKVISNIITSLNKDGFPRGESKLRLPAETRKKVREKAKRESG